MALSRIGQADWVKLGLRAPRSLGRYRATKRITLVITETASSMAMVAMM